MDVNDLAQLAQEMVVRVRDYDPQSNQQWLHAHTTAADREALLYVLAAAVPDDQPWRRLVAWIDDETVRLERRRQQWREAKLRARERSEAA